MAHGITSAGNSTICKLQNILRKIVSIRINILFIVIFSMTFFSELFKYRSR
ncbi:uncharacterized protein METZ01_LOCUS276650 [marine metagenome]|uniref:Uncharacterized protein n=1 Tax=marine metagenome TaxID=408172 RepID=A0A382KI54_9ZZZZ